MNYLNQTISQLPNAELVRLVAGESAAKAYQIEGSLHALLYPSTLTIRRTKRAHYKLDAARELIMRSLSEQLHSRDVLSTPSAVRDFLRLRLGALEHEEFWCLFLDAQHRALTCESLFRGTLTQTSVYPREVVKRALQLNAASIIFAHNHPSGTPEPSEADRLLTQRLKDALGLVDIKVLDHFVVCANSSTSFAERGLL